MATFSAAGCCPRWTWRGGARRPKQPPGGALAAKGAQGRVATVAITAMTFVEPIKVGDMVSIYGEVEKIGRTSITIDLETVVQRRTGTTDIRVNDGTFAFVAIGEAGKTG